MDAVRAKVLVMGPKRCGKTRLANFLSGVDASPNFQEYKPTKGARILEFEESVQAGRKNSSVSVELWDCSGDRQYESCWGAILRDATGVLLVYDPTIKEQEKDIELWYKTYTARLGLGDAQVMILAHQAQAAGGKGNYQAPRSLDKFRFVNSTLDNDDVSRGVKEGFTQFLGAVAVAAAEKSSADMEASLSMVS